jgi:hypothetical protein
VDIDHHAVAELMSGVAAAVARRAAPVHEDVYEVILREIPELRDDKPVLALLGSSVHNNIDTCLQVMQHQIDLADVQAPATAVEYARRQAQRVPGSVCPDRSRQGASQQGQKVMLSAVSKRTCWSWRGRSTLHTRAAVAVSGQCSTRAGTIS